MELVKISELPIKEITTVDAYVPIIDNNGEDIDNYRISLLNLFKTGGIINVNRTYGNANYTLPTALAIIEPTLLTNGVFITFKGMNGWELYQKEDEHYIKYINRVDDALETGSENPLTNDAVTRMYYELLSAINSVASTPHNALNNKNGEDKFRHVDLLYTKQTLLENDKLVVWDSNTNEVTLAKKSSISHRDINYKNTETTYQHVDTTTTKETLVEADKVAIYDSVTGKVVLTYKNNVGGGGGSTDIISTNTTNNTGTIVIDTTPNWQRVNISGGINTLILDYPDGILPTKNREYLLIINNASTTGITLTLPTVSFVKGGITYNFNNTAGSVPIQAGRSIEVNVIFFFIDATTCNIRTQISQFI